MKLDSDAAQVGAADVTDVAGTDGASCGCVTQHADESCFTVVAKHEPQLDDSTSPSKHWPMYCICVINNKEAFRIGQPYQNTMVVC